MSVRFDNLEPIDVRRIHRALISVYDKTGLVSFVSALVDSGVEIVSTGSTASTIADAGLPVTPVEDVTGFLECLEGRVKTLHPRIHAGILADQRKPEHRQELDDLEIAPFDMVVCNLYPFEETVSSGADFDNCVEQIDIGGPSMVRAAAKNFPSVAVVTSPDQYDLVKNAVVNGGCTLEQRRELACEAFVRTANYDAAIADWMEDQLEEDLDRSEASVDCFGDEDEEFTPIVASAYSRLHELRYGENPHQKAAVYTDIISLMGEGEVVIDTEMTEDDVIDEGGAVASSGDIEPGIANARQLHGKEMSFNNYTDGDAALRAAYDHDEPCVAIIKHANPCGIAIGQDIAEAHRKAHACDPVSAFGGVIATNRPVTVELAEQITPIFTEVVLAPSYEEGALEVLAQKKNIRVLQVVPALYSQLEFKQISGGLLLQERDDINDPGDDPSNWQLVSGEEPDQDTMRDLVFAWRTVRSVRSNAILLVKDGASVGVGMGQVNRVDSCKLAIERANTLGGRSTGDAAADNSVGSQADIDSPGGARGGDDVDQLQSEQRSVGSVASSDAFFPFADGLQVLIDAGVKAVVQPGGSKRDQESIDAAQAAGITMYLTGARHFAH